MFGPVTRLPESVEDLQSFRHLLSFCLARRLSHLDSQAPALVLDLEGPEHVAHGCGTDPDLESVAAVLLASLGQRVVIEEFAELQIGIAHVDDDVRLEVEDLLEVPQGDLENVSDPRRQRFQEPDVGNRRRQGDVPHPLATHLRLDDLHTALFTHDPAVLHALVLAAIALVVLYGTENFRAEEPIAFGFERPIVDGLRLFDLAEGPLPDLLRRCQRDPNRAERKRVFGFFEEIVEIAQSVPPVAISVVP